MTNKTTNKIWVLTREHNDYDQFGKYFVAAWASCPTLQQLAEFFALSSELEYVPNAHNVMDMVAFLEHLRNGGGRRGTEDVWFNLKSVGVREYFYRTIDRPPHVWYSVGACYESSA